MAAENFQDAMGALFSGMEEFITTKTVVGDAVHVDGAVILPLMEVTFGAAASTKAEPSRHGGGGGIGGKMTPSALLILKDGNAKLINIKNQTGMTKLIDLTSDVVNKMMNKKESREMRSAMDEAAKDEKTF